MDRTGRYKTANAFGLDVERYLNNKPIRARAASALYRTGRFVRRHRVGVAAAGSFGAFLIGVVIFALAQAAEISREKDRAEHEAERSPRR